MSDATHTRCPQCQTLFRVTAGQLKKARGKVRCGSCSHVFNARNHSIDTSTLDTTPAPTPPAAPLITTPVSTRRRGPEPPYIDSIVDERSRYNNLDTLGHIEIPGEINIPEPPRSTKPNPPLTPPIPLQTSARPGKTKPNRKPSYEDTETQEKPASIDDLEGINTLYEIANAQIARPSPEDNIESIVLEGGVPEAKPPDPVVATTRPERRAPTKTIELSDDSAEGFSDSRPPAPKPKAKRRTSPKEPSMPFSLRSAMSEYEQAPRAPWMTGLLVMSLLLLLTGLVAQVLMFRPIEIVENYPRMLTPMTWFCGHLPCRYTGERDLSQIELVSRDIRTHPSAKNALLINVTIVNHASFKQPYPNLLLSLSNLSGQIIARRQFTPQEYLDKVYNPFLRMEPGTPVHIALAVIDPGEDAINFEFSFQ